MPSTVTFRKLSRESNYGFLKSFISTSKASQNNDFRKILYVNVIIIGLITLFFLNQMFLTTFNLTNSN